MDWLSRGLQWTLSTNTGKSLCGARVISSPPEAFLREVTAEVEKNGGSVELPAKTTPKPSSTAAVVKYTPSFFLLLHDPY